MSRYEWEEGSIIIPSDEWTNFRHCIVKAYNNWQEARCEKAVKLWERIKEHNYTASDNRSYDSPIKELWRRMYHKPDGMYLRHATDTIFRKEHGRPLKPRKKDFPKLPVTTTGKVPVGYEASIAFDFDNRAVHWRVPENNHAREHAWNHPVARVFSRALELVGWTRQSGGYFIGNDEYNRDSTHIGGGGNYVTKTYGPLGDEAHQV